MKSVPAKLQAILWSKDVASFDPEEDKNYIVHQVLRYGTLDHLRWLLKRYPKRQLQQIFLRHPSKIYSKSSLQFAKNFILKLTRARLDETQYLSSLPRSIASRRAGHS